MKILLVCAAGMSTGLLVKNFEKYCEKNGLNHSIDAIGITEYSLVYQNYDVILIAPQIRYKLTEIKNRTNLPCEPIPSFDYAVGNCERMIALAKRLCAQK